MKRQHIFIWTGGSDRFLKQCQPLVDALPDLPDPVPLSRTVLIEYYWGNTKFDIFVTAASLRTTAWGDEEVTWLHCKGMQTCNINSAGETSLMTVLIPAHFITSIGPGTSYKIRTARKTDDLGVFPPIKPTPEGALSLSEVERVLMEFQTSLRN